MTLLEAIMSREGCSLGEAKKILEEIKEEVEDRGVDQAEEVLHEWGFEPDYIFDLF